MPRALYLWSDPARVALLGTAPDAAIAERVGVTPSAVRSARYARGIPAHAPKNAGKGTWTDPAKVALLGTMPDSALARHLRIGLSAVRKARKLRGIPLFHR